MLLTKNLEAPYAGSRIKFGRRNIFSFSILFLRNLKSRKSPISGNPLYCVDSLGLWSGFINPPNIWKVLSQKETNKEKTPRLKCIKMPRIWRTNPLKWVVSISWVYWVYFEKFLRIRILGRVWRIERLFLRGNLILRPALQPVPEKMRLERVAQNEIGLGNRKCNFSFQMNRLKRDL